MKKKANNQIISQNKKASPVGKITTPGPEKHQSEVHPRSLYLENDLEIIQ